MRNLLQKVPQPVKNFIKGVAQVAIGRLQSSPSRLTGKLARDGGSPVCDVRPKLAIDGGAPAIRHPCLQCILGECVWVPKRKRQYWTSFAASGFSVITGQIPAAPK